MHQNKYPDCNIWDIAGIKMVDTYILKYRGELIQGIEYKSYYAHDSKKLQDHFCFDILTFTTRDDGTAICPLYKNNEQDKIFRSCTYKISHNKAGLLTKIYTDDSKVGQYYYRFIYDDYARIVKAIMLVGDDINQVITNIRYVNDRLDVVESVSTNRHIKNFHDDKDQIPFIDETTTFHFRYIKGLGMDKDDALISKQFDGDDDSDG